MGTLALPHITATTTKLPSPPPLSGNPHGHTGHVRFLTAVEMTSPPTSSNSILASSSLNLVSSSSASGTTSSTDRALGQPFAQQTGGDGGRALRPVPRISPGGQGRILVISGGDGYEDFSSSASNDLAGREDSTNHLLLWTV